VSHEFLPAKRGSRALVQLPLFQTISSFGGFVMTMNRTSLRLALSASAIALSAMPNAASAAMCNWAGGTNVWTNVGQWSCGVQPGAGDNVFITAGSSVVNLTAINAFAGTLTLGSGNAMNLTSSFLSINGGAVTNNGVITLADASRLFSGGAAGTAFNIGGSGTITLDNSVNYAQLGGGYTMTTLGAGQTVRGSGQVGFDQTTIINNGLISASSGTGISLDGYGGSSGVGGIYGAGADGVSTFVNNGTVEAINGKTLSFESGRFDNINGTIRALNGATVVLNSDARIIGGTLTTDATSSITANGTNEYLQGVTLSSGSKLTLDGDFIYVNASLANNGTITIGNASRLASETGAGTALNYTGTGTIVLDNSANYAQLGGGYSITTLGIGQTVRGSGQIGFDQTTIINNGLISASAGTGISLDGYGGSSGVGAPYGAGADGISTFVNNGTMEATGIGRALTFEAGRFDNINGMVRALNGATVVLNSDARIIGGTLTTDATSSVTANGFNEYLQGVTLGGGSSLILDNDFVYVNGSLTNNGTITIRNVARLASETGAGTALDYNGTGTIILDSSANYAQLGGGYSITTLGAGQTVRGSGQVGFDQTTIINNGLISADSGTGISVDGYGGNNGVGAPYGAGADGASTFVNNATMQATNGTSLTFLSGRFDNINGLVRALNGSTVVLDGDARIIGGTLTSDATSSIMANGPNEYLQGVTLSNGSKLALANDFVYVNGSLANNGTITIANASRLLSETGAGTTLNYTGTGTIVLDNSANYAQLGGNYATTVIGAGQTVRGSGQVGFDQTTIINNGLISADAGTGISLDGYGGSSGVGAPYGAGTDGTTTFVNNGTIAAAGSTISFESGRFQNSLGATIAAYTGSSVVMNSDANLTNLQAGNVLNLGSYISSTAGAASTLNIRGTGANSISTIGTAAAATDTTVTLSGANSVFNVTNFGTGVNTTLDSSLFVVAKSGQLNLLSGRNMTIAANSGNFTNSGLVQLGGSALTAASFNNVGTLRAISGINSSTAVTGSTGRLETLGGATLNLGGASSAGFLSNDGTLGIGANTVTVTSDYTNAAFGTGNAFTAHANITGNGLINATSATMDLSGPALSGGILNVGNVRTGGSSSTTLTITNNGTATTLRGAVQNALAPSVALTGADWVIGPNGGSTNVTISYTGLTAGSLSGQTLGVVNNFDNVANKTIGLAGNVYQVAQAGSLPTTLTLGARRVGDAAATAGFAIANTAPIAPGFNEDLQAISTVGSGFTLNGLGSLTVAALGAGGTAPVTLSHSTATAGAFNSVVSIANTSLAVAGSGLANLALAGQSINIAENVYAKVIASLAATTVNFGVVRKGSVSPTGSVGVANTAVGALTDTLVTSTSAMPAGVTATAPGGLTAGQSGTVNFSLNTATAGVISGSGSLDFKSTNSEMADLALASQSVAFSGTVTDLASGAIFKNGGLGIFAGSANAFTLDLGSLATNSGVVTTDLGVTNLVVPSAFAELLGGSFTQGGGTGFSFAGNSFTGLAGGLSNLGNLLSFDTTGLANGTYTKQVTFNGFSAFTGLNNFSLTPINVNITATVTGNIGGAVPEPATWLMMLFGFGLVGSSIRRTSAAAARQMV
jgi:PEP-CTERM motif